MSLITMAVYSTEENKKDEYLSQTLHSLEKTVDFSKHRLILVVNAMTKVTGEIMYKFNEIIEDTIYNGENLGTAEAINLGWKTRQPNENAVKMDDDVIIHQAGWMDLMDALCWDDKWIGQVGLKRKDLIESPDNPNEFYRSKIYDIAGIKVEQCHHIMGTCVMHSANLLNELGYMWQPKLYGFDDSLMSLRSELAGFKNVFIPEIEIDHIDPGQTPFQTWKQNEANIYLAQKDGISEYETICNEYKLGIRDIYYNPYE